MPLWLASTASLRCTMGLIPSIFNVLPKNRVLANVPLATMIDNIPILNIPPFGLCKSPANPQVASIIAASLGSVTQGPCIPMPAGPWLMSSPKILCGMTPCITTNSKLICMWGGIISPGSSGQTKVMLR